MEKLDFFEFYSKNIHEDKKPEVEESENLFELEKEVNVDPVNVMDKDTIKELAKQVADLIKEGKSENPAEQKEE